MNNWVNRSDDYTTWVSNDYHKWESTTILIGWIWNHSHREWYHTLKMYSAMGASQWRGRATNLFYAEGTENCLWQKEYNCLRRLHVNLHIFWSFNQQNSWKSVIDLEKLQREMTDSRWSLIISDINRGDMVLLKQKMVTKLITEYNHKPHRVIERVTTLRLKHQRSSAKKTSKKFIREEIKENHEKRRDY